MKNVLFALTVTMLLVPQFVFAESTDKKEADEEYMLLLRYALERMPVSPVDPGQDKALETLQKKKIIISIIPDSPCILPLDCP
ncbi:MAG: hypothetical protein HQL08_15105 [Nitrospirae bacterium]|nr:hypothetical protein [Nitrospirota bacterium]